MAPARKHKLYSREKKIIKGTMISCNSKNIIATLRNIPTDCKGILNCVEHKKVIRKYTRRTKAGRYCKALYHLMSINCMTSFWNYERVEKASSGGGIT